MARIPEGLQRLDPPPRFRRGSATLARRFSRRSVPGAIPLVARSHEARGPADDAGAGTQGLRGGVVTGRSTPAQAAELRLSQGGRSYRAPATAALRCIVATGNFRGGGPLSQ